MKSKAVGIQIAGEANDIWDLQIRPKRNSSGKIISGVVIGDTLHQNQACILAFRAGELKFNPTLGVGLIDELLEEDLLEARHRIRENFQKDGLTIKSLELYDPNKINIDADY